MEPKTRVGMRLPMVWQGRSARDVLIALIVAGSSLAAVAPNAAHAAAPTPIFLWYADGGPVPSEGEPCVGHTPPRYACSFGATTEECQRKVQAYLDAWYADFNVVFTLRKPTTGPYYTVVITSGGAWCAQSSSIGGVAPINCQDLRGGTAYAFACGYDARSCATVIAQEQAHMVGLGHTTSRADAMFPVVQPTSEGFEDQQNDISAEQCRTTQNSYRMMRDRLGAWSGGTKPDPFAPLVMPAGADGGADEVTGAGFGSSVGARPSPGPASPPDGGANVPPGTAVTSGAPAGGDDWDPPAPGCTIAPAGSASSGAPAVVLLLAAATGAARIRSAGPRRRSAARRPPEA